MPDTNCINGNLWPYLSNPTKPWDERRIKHLYRRLGFGPNRTELAEAIGQDPETLIDNLLDDAANSGLMTPPSWSGWTIFDYLFTNPQTNEQEINFDQLFEHFGELVYTWIQHMVSHPVREKMTLFWANHFVTVFEDYECTPAAYQYHKLIQEQAFGNFRDFVYEMGLNPAMLLFLNGNENTAEEPNENYARELYELFSLGRDNGYTQQDIVETARALTGYTTEDCVNVVFEEELWDPDEKTIFGQTGEWGYEDVIDILFEQKAELIARYICEKLYRYFVYDTPNEAIIEQLATTFMDHDFELMPVYKLLFKSEHFFDDEVIGVRVKSPMEIQISYIREMHLPLNDDFPFYVFELGEIMGQTLLSPIDVAGWPGYHAWIDTSRLTARWDALQNFNYYLIDTDPDSVMNWVRELVDNSNDPSYVTSKLVDFILPNGLQTPEAYLRATNVFKSDIPQNYFDDGIWNLNWQEAKWQVLVLLIHIARLPEFQLS